LTLCEHGPCLARDPEPVRTFIDRRDAGRQLGRAVAELTLDHPVVLALPRGGVPVAVEVAHAIGAPLEVLLVRKIGAPDQPELAVAAVVDGEQPQVVRDDETMRLSGVDDAYVDAQAQLQLDEIERRRACYLHGRAPMPLGGRAVVVVDDGIATGTTVRAGLQALRRLEVSQVVLAVPVAPPEALARLRPLVDEIVCLASPPFFHAVGAHYVDFHQVSDAEVVALLDAAAGS
jgi:putative phosphoribosyl transferase